MGTNILKINHSRVPLTRKVSLKMLRKTLKTIVGVALIGALAGLAWTGYGQINTSAAAYFDSSINMVEHQTVRMNTALSDVGNLVETEIDEITNISILIDRWTPLYSQAHPAYQRFDAAIMAAEVRAEAYFVAQRALTQQYHNEDLRSRAEANDEADYALYIRWRDRAREAREQALEIVKKLDDMDTDLRKLELSSGFSIDPAKFTAVPSDILDLSDHLVNFQTASVNIREITASPFETN